MKGNVDAEIADPDLDAATIAAPHYISRRYLRRLFEGEGDSVARWIRMRRLAQAIEVCMTLENHCRNLLRAGFSEADLDHGGFERLVRALVALHKDAPSSS
jgi:AraC-like DNA-binding protein